MKITIAEIDEIVDSINLEIQALTPFSFLDLVIEKQNDEIRVKFIGNVIWNNYSEEYEDYKYKDLYYLMKYNINDIIRNVRNLFSDGF